MDDYEKKINEITKNYKIKDKHTLIVVSLVCALAVAVILACIIIFAFAYK